MALAGKVSPLLSLSSSTPSLLGGFRAKCVQRARVHFFPLLKKVRAKIPILAGPGRSPAGNGRPGRDSLLCVHILLCSHIVHRAHVHFFGTIKGSRANKSQIVHGTHPAHRVTVSTRSTAGNLKSTLDCGSLSPTPLLGPLTPQLPPV